MTERTDKLRGDGRNLAKILDGIARAGYLTCDLDPNDPTKQLGEEDHFSTRSEAFMYGLETMIHNLQQAPTIAIFIFCQLVCDLIVLKAAMHRYYHNDMELWDFVTSTLEKQNVESDHPTVFPLEINYGTWKEFIEWAESQK